MSSDIIKTIEDYLLEVSLSSEKVNDGMWVLHDQFDNIDNIVISYEDPIVIFRVKLMESPKNNKEEFYELLLQLNANSMIHGAYGLEDDHVVIVDTLEAENLDFNEFQASIDAIILAISQDYKKLSKYLNS